VIARTTACWSTLVSLAYGDALMGVSTFDFFAGPLTFLATPWVVLCLQRFQFKGCLDWLIAAAICFASWVLGFNLAGFVFELLPESFQMTAFRALFLVSAIVATITAAIHAALRSYLTALSRRESEAPLTPRA